MERLLSLLRRVVGLTNVVSTVPRNIYDLGNDLGYEFSKLLVVIKGADLLDLVTTPGDWCVRQSLPRRAAFA